MKRRGVRNPGRVANRVSVEEARRLDAESKMGWREWEKDVDGILRANRWGPVFVDRVLPSALLRSWGLNDAQIKRLNSARRRRGLPDKLVSKAFDSPRWVGYSLLRAAYGDFLARVMWAEAAQIGRVSVVGFIECKTGGATTTKEQDEWLRVARLCPGVFAFEARPTHRDWLVEILGGERGAY